MEQQMRAWAQSNKSPSLFVTDILGATPEAWQAEALELVATQPRLAIRSGHGVGKTSFQSWVILWTLLTSGPNTNVVVTANSQDQLRDVVWKEVHKWWSRLPEPLKDQIEVNADRIQVKGYENSTFATARTARPERPEALQGFHADNILVVVEEASGIEDVIFEVAQGMLSSHTTKILMCGNPTRNSGYFYRAFHENRHNWATMHVPCSASSRVDPQFAIDVAQEFGEDSNVYRVRVDGNFPVEEDDQVIPLGLVEAAVTRDIHPSETGISWGVDIAAFGDDSSALAKRRGNTLLEPVKWWRKTDLMTSAGIIKREWDETPVGERPSVINVDAIGMGAGVCSRLYELGLPAFGINVGEQASVDSSTYLRLRDELWFQARDWFASRTVKIPRDEKLISELVGPKYSITSTGKYQVESKKDMKKRGVKSPDLADAFCMTFAGGDIPLAKGFEQAITEYDPFDHSYRESVEDGFSMDQGLDYDPFSHDRGY